MKAAVIHNAGGPEVLKLEQIPIPVPEPGYVLIKIHAFGLNRSDLFTRLGHSPNVKFPRVLGIECVGTVAQCPGNELEEGQIVATCMGGLGRDFDGGYAEYTAVPVGNVQVIETRQSEGWWRPSGMGNSWCLSGDVANELGQFVHQPED